MFLKSTRPETGAEQQERNQYANFQAAAALTGILTTIFDPDIYTNMPVDLVFI